MHEQTRRELAKALMPFALNGDRIFGLPLTAEALLAAIEPVIDEATARAFQRGVDAAQPD